MDIERGIAIVTISIVVDAAAFDTAVVNTACLVLNHSVILVKERVPRVISPFPNHLIDRASKRKCGCADLQRRSFPKSYLNSEPRWKWLRTITIDSTSNPQPAGVGPEGEGECTTADREEMIRHLRSS